MDGDKLPQAAGRTFNAGNLNTEVTFAMGILTAEIKAAVKSIGLCFVATASKDGMPNVSPKGSLTVWVMVFWRLRTSRRRAR